MVDIHVDCTVPAITVTWHAIVSDSFDDADFASMKKLLQSYWQGPFTYGSCPVTFVFDLVRSSDVKPADKAKYDDIKKKGPGGGDTHGAGVPDAHHDVLVSAPSDITHEFGHCVGMRDKLIDDGTGPKHWRHWDENMMALAGAGLPQLIVWHAPGKELEAKCCKPKHGYVMDHEVGVKLVVEPSKTNPKNLIVDVIATSLSHAISAVRIWDCNGSQVGPDITKLQRSQDGTVRDPQGFPPQQVDTSEWPHKARNDAIKVPKDGFPICVDVVEEGDTKEKSDAHRHGWFGQDGQPVDADGHLLEPGRKSTYYPTFRGGGKAGPGKFVSPI